MKLSTAISHATLLGWTMASQDAYLWTVDTDTKSQRNNNQVSSISSSAAEQILARRRGLSDTGNMKITDESLIADLNQYGGWQQPLVADSSDENPAKVFIRISGFEKAVSEFNILPDLWVEEPTTTLRQTLEAKGDMKSVCEYDIKVRSKADASVKYSYFKKSESCLSQKEIEMQPTIMALMATLPAAEDLVGKGIATFHRTLMHLAATGNIESTLLVLPKDSALKRPLKSELRKRQERPLDLPLDSAQENEPSTIKAPNNATLPKNIPKYFTSESACQNQTNSCSGHGKCVKAHGDQYKCSCSATVIRDNGSGSKKTLQWGGNACQKKDISFQFILFAAFGIFFSAMVAGGIGMLFKMGSEELPSVIGAGVVGPRAQR